MTHNKRAIDLNKENLRKCVGCGILAPRNEMIKITKLSPEGTIVINPNSKTFGRSAYLCYNQSCINIAFKKNKLNKVLKTNKTLEDLKGTLDGQFKS